LEQKSNNFFNISELKWDDADVAANYDYDVIKVDIVVIVVVKTKAKLGLTFYFLNKWNDNSKKEEMKLV